MEPSRSCRTSIAKIQGKRGPPDLGRRGGYTEVHVLTYARADNVRIQSARPSGSPVAQRCLKAAARVGPWTSKKSRTLCHE